MTDYQTMEALIEEAVNGIKTDEEIEARIIYYLRRHRQITQSESEFKELTTLLRGAGVDLDDFCALEDME